MFKLKRVKVSLALCLAFVMILGMSSIGLAQEISDIEGHWAKETIEAYTEVGLVTGYPDGTFRPENSITRAEFVTIIHRTFSSDASAELTFTDVNESDWFAEALAHAVSVGYITGYPDGTFRPNDLVTRQETAVMISRLLELGSSTSANTYADADQIENWAQDAIGALKDTGLMVGFNNQFQPSNNLKRAEAVVAVDNVVKMLSFTQSKVVNQAGTYGPAQGVWHIWHDFTVDAADITLQNIVVHGDLTLGAGIGEGDVTLKNIEVKGDTTIQGGGENSIHLDNVILVKVIVNKAEGTVRIVAEGTTVVGELNIQSGAIIESTGSGSAESGEGAIGFLKVVLDELLPAETVVSLLGDYEDVEINAKEVQVTIPQGSIKNLNVGENAEGTKVTVSEEATIVQIILNAAANIAGKGAITEAVINANGVEIEQKPESVEVSEGTSAQVGGQPVSGTPTTPSTPPSDPGPAPDTTAPVVLKATAKINGETVEALVTDGNKISFNLSSDYDDSELVTEITIEASSDTSHISIEVVGIPLLGDTTLTSSAFENGVLTGTVAELLGLEDEVLLEDGISIEWVRALFSSFPDSAKIVDSSGNSRTIQLDITIEP